MAASIRRWTVLALASVSLLTGCSATSGATPASTGGRAGAGTEGNGVVRIAAAADLKFALEDIVDIARAQYPALTIDTTYGSSGTFLQQIGNGAPFDLYLSADLEYPRRLVADGHAEEADLFPYAVGRLVLWTPEGSDIDPSAGLSVLTDPRVARVSIANPDHAPYGKAAVAALGAAGIRDEVAPKLVLGENIAQAAEFVQSGNADAGVVAMSLVLSDPLQDEGRWKEIPLEDYPRLDQGGVVLSDAQDIDAARAVRDVLLSAEGTSILAEYGFSLPGS